MFMFFVLRIASSVACDLPEEVVEEQPPQLEAPTELNEDEVLSYIGKRYGKEINSIDELVSQREESAGF